MTKEAASTAGREVVRQHWAESERGWGIRPDGYSCHLSMKDRGRFIEGYWNSMPDQVPDEYSRPEGEPHKVVVEETLFQQLKGAREEGKPGLRVYRG